MVDNLVVAFRKDMLHTSLTPGWVWISQFRGEDVRSTSLQSVQEVTQALFRLDLQLPADIEPVRLDATLLQAKHLRYFVAF